MLVVGIDENGYGPLLGPLVVTATLLEVEDEKLLLKGNLKESKQVFLSGEKMSDGEILVLSFYLHLKKHKPATPQQFLADLILPIDDNCNSPLSICSPQFRLPHWCDDDAIDEGLATQFLKEVGAKLVEIKSISLCPAQFNKRAKNISKAQLDYLLFETLILHMRNQYPEKRILFLCGFIGSTKNYSQFFYNLASEEWEEESNNAEVRYVFPNWGEIRFIKDGDKLYFPIALSSLVGKYIRELFIEQLNIIIKEHIQGINHTSGYPNTQTNEFITKTSKLRAKLGIPESCFIRCK